MPSKPTTHLVDGDPTPSENSAEDFPSDDREGSDCTSSVASFHSLQSNKFHSATSQEDSSRSGTATPTSSCASEGSALLVLSDHASVDSLAYVLETAGGAPFYDQQQRQPASGALGGLHLSSDSDAELGLCNTKAAVREQQEVLVRQEVSELKRRGPAPPPSSEEVAAGAGNKRSSCYGAAGIIIPPLPRLPEQKWSLSSSRAGPAACSLGGVSAASAPVFEDCSGGRRIIVQRDESVLVVEVEGRHALWGTKTRAWFGARWKAFHHVAFPWWKTVQGRLVDLKGAVGSNGGRRWVRLSGRRGGSTSTGSSGGEEGGKQPLLHCGRRRRQRYSEHAPPGGSGEQVVRTVGAPYGSRVAADNGRTRSANAEADGEHAGGASTTIDVVNPPVPYEPAPPYPSRHSTTPAEDVLTKDASRRAADHINLLGGVEDTSKNKELRNIPATMDSRPEDFQLSSSCRCPFEAAAPCPSSGSCAGAPPRKNGGNQQEELTQLRKLERGSTLTYDFSLGAAKLVTTSFADEDFPSGDSVASEDSSDLSESDVEEDHGSVVDRSSRCGWDEDHGRAYAVTK